MKYYLRLVIVFILSLLLGGLSSRPVLAQNTDAIFVRSVDWRNKGTSIAVSTRQGLTIYDMAFNPLVFLPFPNDIDFVAETATFSPDGTRLLMGNQILDSSTLQTVMTIVDNILPYSGQWSSDGTEIAFSGGSDRELRIYSSIDGRLLRTFSSIEWVAGAEFGPYWSPDGRYFATLADGNAVYIMDAVQGTRLARLQINADSWYPLVWSPDSTKLAMGTYTLVPLGSPGSSPVAGSATQASRSSIIILDVTTGETVSEILGGGSGMVWNPDGRQLVAFQSGALNFWDTSTGVLIGRYSMPLYRASALEYSAYGGQLMIAGIPTDAPPTPNSAVNELDAPLNPISSVQRTGVGGIITIVTPDPSPERLTAIAAACDAPSQVLEAITVVADTQAPNTLSALTETIETLPEGTIPPGCAADLIAVAEALAN